MATHSSAVDVPASVASAARRYRRIDRLLRFGLVFVLVAGTLVVADWSLWQSALLTVGAVALLSVPLLRTEGTARLRTTTDLDAVRRDFRSPTPPMLALQWSGAESIRPAEDGGGVCEFSYLLGLRSTELRIDIEGHPVADSDAAFDVVVTAGERSWATYEVELRQNGGVTTVDLTWTSDRQFALLRFLAWPAVHRSQRTVLEAQGYEVVERTVSLRR